MRSYVITPGGIPAMSQRWKEYLPGRIKLSPLTGVFTATSAGSTMGAHLGLQEPR